MPESRYEIIDAHAHIFPGKIAKKAVESIRDFYDLAMYYDGLPHTLVESGKACGINKFLVFSTATQPEQVQIINSFIAGKCRKYPQFMGMGALHPDMDKPEAEIEKLIQLGFYGIKLHPDFQCFNIDDEKSVRLCHIIAGYHLPVLFHMGDSRYEYSRPIRLYNLLQKVPDLVCIAAHFGGYERWEEAAKYLKDGPIYFDTSSTLPFVETAYAKDMLMHFGVERFFFGTDYPMWNYEDELERFRKLNLSAEENRLILAENFKRLFKIK